MAVYEICCNTNAKLPDNPYVKYGSYFGGRVTKFEDKPECEKRNKTGSQCAPFKIRVCY
jgi:hypothetical protein